MAADTDDLMGQNGVDYFADTSAHTVGGSRAHWSAIKAHGGTATVATVTVVGGNVGTLTSFTLLQGEVLTGQFSGITLTSGAVLCYRSAR